MHQQAFKPVHTRASMRVNGREVKGSLFGVCHSALADGSAVIAAEDGRSYLAPQRLVAAAGLYPAQTGRRVRIDTDANDAVTAIEKA
jgi:hypothetical protein